MTEHYLNKITVAIGIYKKYFSIGSSVISHIGKSNQPEEACAKLFLHAGANLSGQILKALKIGHLQLAVVGLRSLFEMSVNSLYIFNHPKFQKNKTHVNKISLQYIDLIHTVEEVNHTRLNNKSFKLRAEEAGFGDVYKRNYRILSEWAHLQGQTPYLYKPEYGEKFGITVAELTVHSLHNIFDPVCFYYDFKLDPELEKEVIAFK